MFRFQLFVLIGVAMPLGAQGAPAAACAGAYPYAECALAAGGIPELREMTALAGEREVRFWVAPDGGAPTRLLRLVQRGDAVAASLALLWPGTARGTAMVTGECRQEVWRPTAGFCLGELPPSRDWADVLRQLDTVGLANTRTAPARGTVCDRTPLPPLVPGGLPRDPLCAVMVHPTIYLLEVRTPDRYWRYRLLDDPRSTDPNAQRDARILRLLTCAIRDGVTDRCTPSHAINVGGPARCVPPNREVTDLWGFLGGLMSSRAGQDFRTRHRLPVMTAAELQIVSDDALCAKAALLLPARYGRMAREANQFIRLVRIGSVYWAEDGRMGGEWLSVFILDSALTRVVQSRAR